MADDKVDSPAEGNNPDEPQRPEWLPENFKSPEDFVKSYNEAQNKIREQGSQLNAVNENYEELATRFDAFEQQRTQQAQQGQAAPLITAYEEAYQNGDATRMLAIQAEISKLAVQQGLAEALPQLQQRVGTLAQSQADEIGAYAARTLEQRYGNQWEQATDAMRNILTERPWLIPEQAQTDPRAAIDALDNVYKLATYGATPVQDTGAVEREKELAQTASGAGQRVLSPDEAKVEWDQIRAARPKNYWE